MTEYPKTWIEIPFQEVLAKLSNGTTLPQHSEPPGIPVSRIETISEAKINLDRIRYVREITEEQKIQFSLQAGDILFSHINSDSHLGKCALYRGGKPLLHGMNLLLIRIFPQVSAEFVEAFLLYLRRKGYFIGIAQHAVNQSSLNQKKIQQIPFPLPPLPEQRRIVAKIEELFSELDQGVENLKQARAQLAVYRQSLLKHAFEGHLTAAWRSANANAKTTPPTNPVSESDRPPLPKSWAYARLGDLIEQPTYGTAQKCAYDTPGTGVLRIPNLVSGVVDASDLKFAQFTPEEIQTYALIEGDLLIIRSNGSVSIVGRCAQVQAAHTHLLFAGYLIRLRPKAEIASSFLLHQLRSHLVRVQIENAAKSTSGVNNINSKEIQSLVVVWCPFAEQNELVNALEPMLTALDVVEADIDANLRKAEALRQAILKKAFAGELVPQDPADEPAPALLARLRSARATTPATPRRGRKPAPTQA